jgi:thiol-disulfide isomerase/thioredoxin
MKHLAIVSAMVALLGGAALAEPTTKPTTKPAPIPGTFEAYQTTGTAIQKKYKALVPDNNLLSDANAAQRASIAVQAIPMLKEELVDLEAMARLKPGYKWPVMAVHVTQQAALYALGDSDTVSMLNQQMKQPGREGLRARDVVLRARWYMAGDDTAKQQAVIADVDQLASANPTDPVLSTLIFDMGSSTKDPDVKSHVVDLLTNTMDNQTADGCLRQLEANDKVHSFANKPMVLSGKLVDGKEFSTAEWTGKVVLVDFWATWCVPCREELPRVQKVYADYHDKGLEVLGVSNDESGKQLVKIVNMLKLPWPQLFDADAAAKGAWNPITLQHGIEGIPVMFLIDKKGVCRTVSCRDNFEQLIPQLLQE